ncbi:MAG: nitronate monooxygenase [Actinomycetes bacterium]
MVSFTFGIPGAADVRRLQRAGSTVLATVTHVDELTAAEEAGVDGVVVQGPRAGAHSGTSQPTRPLVDRPTSGLVAELRAVSTLRPTPPTARHCSHWPRSWAPACPRRRWRTTTATPTSWTPSSAIPSPWCPSPSASPGPPT